MSTARAKFREAAAAIAGDSGYRAWMQSALRGYEEARAGSQGRFVDWEGARRAAAAIKWEAIERLDELLAEFAGKIEKRGAKVFFADDAEAARAYVVDVMRRSGARTVVKSKCMTSEEIELNDLLEREGFEVVESDLGELIVQLRGEPPYHFVFPAMHLRRDEIRRVFEEKLGDGPSEDPEELTMVARRAVRRKYVAADVGFSGANFAVADAGMISITENEGNARLTTSLPRVHVALLGIEKVIPRLADLALLLPMLATAGTGQHLSCYNSMIGGPRGEGEADGPEELHVVLLDNGRTRLLADPELRDALRCIRCGACLNVCPIFKNVGGHTYGTTYQGPIGAVITPHLRGIREWKHLSFASSLCGACTETCPVRIDLHRHLLRNRSDAVRESSGAFERLAFRLLARAMRRPRLWSAGSKAARWIERWTRPLHGTRLDVLRRWRETRELPRPPARTFREYWRTRS
jgi:L-lactate dehydrogenase complex protein LldF